MYRPYVKRGDSLQLATPLWFARFLDESSSPPFTVVWSEQTEMWGEGGEGRGLGVAEALRRVQTLSLHRCSVKQRTVCAGAVLILF